ncbi:MAG: hypothetical protein AAGG44_19320, partial [Planctomycetota bacterium]
ISEMALVEPGESLTHSFKTKSSLDEKLRRTTIKGPVGFSHPVDGQKVDRPAYLNWYQISYGGGDSEHNLTLGLPQQDRLIQAKVGPAEFFLTPAQRITSGPPSDVPESLGLFKAYRVIELQGWKTREAKLAGTFSGVNSVSLSDAVYICLPAEESHHDEVIEIQDPTACWIVFKTDKSTTKTKVTSIDQLGMQNLSSISAEHILVPAKLVVKKK